MGWEWDASVAIDTDGPREAFHAWHSPFQIGWATHRKVAEGVSDVRNHHSLSRVVLRSAATTPHMAVSSQGMAALRWYWLASRGPSWERLRSMLQFYLS